MKDRLLHFLTHERISPAHFADLIGVQRSSVSHILAGRNNPGLEFIQKILNAYPKINSEWLIMGKGDIYKQAKQASLFDQPLIVSQENKKNEPILNKEIVENKDGSETKTSDPIKQHVQPENKIPELSTIEIPKHNDYQGLKIKLEKVLFIYSDASFEVFYPTQKL